MQRKVPRTMALRSFALVVMVFAARPAPDAQTRYRRMAPAGRAAPPIGSGLRCALSAPPAAPQGYAPARANDQPKHNQTDSAKRRHFNRGKSGDIFKEV